MSELSANIDPGALRDALGSFATGVTVLTTRTDEGDHGMTANAFMSVSLSPPLLCISLDGKSKLLDKVRAAGRYAVNILASDMQPLALHFAGKHNPDLANVLESRDGLPILPKSSAIFLADVVQEIEAGDHFIFLGHITDFENNKKKPPLLFSSGQFCEISPH